MAGSRSTRRRPTRFKVRLSKRGYRGEPLIVSADEPERVWKLEQALDVSLSILDAADGKPIKRSEIERGRVNPDGSTTWAAGNPRPELGIATEHEVQLFGRGNVRLDTAAPAWKLRVSAQGYRPVETRVIKNDEGSVRLVAKLERLAHGEGGGPSGTVIDAAGKPVAGAEVMMASPEEGAMLYGDSWWQGQGVYAWSGLGTVVTDDRGRFTFSPIQGTYTLAAATRDAYGDAPAADFARDPVILVGPWGVVEGRVLAGSRPVADAQVRIRSDEPPRGRPISLSASYRTDDQGRFRFDKVPPGTVEVEYSSNTHILNGTFVSVRPGQVASATVGGAGRPSSAG